MGHQLLIASSLVAAALVNSDMTAIQRVQKLKNFFVPAIGDKIFVDTLPLTKKEKENLANYRGSIEVNPPKGTCFKITKRDDLDDIKVCEKKLLSFNLDHLNDKGELRWKISSGPGDFGNEYTWPSDYRMAQIVRVGERIPTVLPIAQCLAQIDHGKKRIVLSMLNGERWVFNFPDDDKHAGDTGHYPNLYMPAKKGGLAGGIPASERAEAKDSEDKLLDPMDTWDLGKKEDHVAKHWVIPDQNSFVMSSTNFKINQDMPSGSNGVCRYRYSGAPGEPSAGWIECHAVDMYEVVLAPLHCIGGIKQ